MSKIAEHARILTPHERATALLGDAKAKRAESQAPQKENTPHAHESRGGRFFSQSEAQQAHDALESLFSAPVVVVPTPKTTGASDRGTNAKRWPSPPMSVALAQTHKTDSHVQCCIVPALIDASTNRAARARIDAISEGDASINYILLDYDLEDHASGRMTPTLFRELIREMSAQSTILERAAWYSTRGGLRAVVRLAHPFALDPSARGADWSAFYTHIVAGLPRPARWDLACKDATRLMRAPWVRRDGEDQRGEIYVPDTLGAYELNAADVTVVVASLTRATSSRRDGVAGDKLIQLFDRLDWMGEEFKAINGAPSYLVKCPLHHMHSSDNETSTILHAVEDDGGYVLHCLHNSCRQVFAESGGWRAYIQQRHPDEWRDVVGREEIDYIFDPNDHWGFVEQAVEILETTFPSRIFRRHDAIATVERDIHGGARWRAWSVADLTGLLNRVGRWSQTTKDGDRRRASVPERLVKIHHLAIADELPLCESCTTLPPLDPTTLEPTRFSEGYCEISRSYFLPSPQLDLNRLRRIYETPASPARAASAYMRLIDIYSDFPWRTKSHQIFGAAIALTVALRRSMDVAPMMFVSANNKGVGKTKLISAAAASVYGSTPPLASLPVREEELKKVLDSLVHTDTDMFIADNVASRIGGATLDAFLTSPLHSYRPLGVTDTRVAPNRVFIGATGNNATLSGDTDRRAIMIRLVTDLENPEQRRGFRYPDLLTTARSRISDTWCAILEILRAWRAVGVDERDAILETARPFGSYERWAELVRDPLMWISGIAYGAPQDVVALSREEVDVAKEDDRTELFTVLADWQASRSHTQTWTSRELYRAIHDAIENDGDAGLATIGEMLPRFNLTAVSRLVGARRDQVNSGYRLTARKIGGTLTYTLTPVDGAPPPPPPQETPPRDPFRDPTPTPTPTPTTPPPTTPPTSDVLRVLNWSTACDISEAFQVSPELIEAYPQYEPLSRRCAYLRGDICARERVPCEFKSAIDGDAAASMTQPLTDALRSTMSDDLERVKAPTLIELSSTDHPRAIEIIAAEYAVKATQQNIAARLNDENIPPPNGRKWTGAKVGVIARRNQITRPLKQAVAKHDRILERDGHWSGYWPDAHPLTTPAFSAPSVAQSQHGNVSVSATDILSGLYGRALDCRDAFNARVRKEADA